MLNETAVVRVSRRSLLEAGAKAVTSLGLSTLLGRLTSGATLERACVCVYLAGGNDSNNMIVPLDSPAYDAYARGRGELALPVASLLPVKSPATSGTYGFHPALAGLQDLYNRGLLSVVANVGQADQPFSKGQFDASQLPANQFDHSHDSEIRYLPDGRLAMSWDPDARRPAWPTASSVNNTTLTERLAGVARELSRGNSRATFTVTLAGFDTHRNELARQAKLFAELNDGLTSFYENLRAMGISDRVLIFTATEFNRTLAPNAAGGTEHAWGGHNLVLGGAVRGGEVYGRFPSMELGGPDDLGATGIWIPSVSSRQFSSTIARWYGVADRNFSQPELSFLSGR